MEILNKTPHILRFYDESERIVVGEVRPEPRAARVFVRRERVEDMQIQDVSVPVSRISFGPVKQPSLEEHGGGYVVSQMVRSACPERNDLYVVDQIDRDRREILGCRSLAVWID